MIKLNTLHLITLSSLAILSTNSAYAQRGGGPAPVAVVAIEQTGEDADESFVGTSAPFRHAIIGSAVEGRVQHVYADEGMYFEVPDAPMSNAAPTSVADEPTRPPLVQIRTETLSILIRSAEAAAQVSQLEYELQQELLPKEIEQAKLDVDAAQAAAEYARKVHERQKQLLESDSGAIASELVDASYKEKIETESAKLNAEIRLELLTKSLDAKLEQAKARADVDREALNLLIDQQSKYTIRAPFSGVISTQHAEVGDWIKQGDPVVEIMQLDPIELRVAVPEDFIARLAQQMRQATNNDETLEVEVRFQANPYVPFKGRVVRIAPQADLRARTFPVLIHVDNPDDGDGPLLHSGMLAEVDLPIGRKDQRLLVPKDALVLNGASYSVVVVEEQTNESGEKQLVARSVPVTVGVSIDNRIEIRGEVEPGQLVATEGNERLRPGQAVRIVNRQ